MWSPWPVASAPPCIQGGSPVGCLQLFRIDVHPRAHSVGVAPTTGTRKHGAVAHWFEDRTVAEGYIAHLTRA